MPESITQRFITELEPHRDALFTQALAEAGDPIRAEGLLQSAIHAMFEAYATGTVPQDKPLIEWFVETLASLKKDKSGSAPVAIPEGTAMPAATWARLYGAAQLEAVRFDKGKSLNPDSVLLSPDPLLAPKKTVRGEDGDALERHPAHFFVLSAAAALVLGIVLTVLISSRKIEVPATEPATESASQPATQVST